MKTTILVSALFVGLSLTCSTVLAQNTPADDVITVPRSALPADVLQQVEEQQQLQTLKRRVEAYGQWVGVGKEVGVAINDALVAITDQADTFSKTGVGKFTMFIVAYKVLGRDLVGVLIGIPMLVAWVFLWIWYVKKNTMAISLLSKVHPDGTKEYEVLKRDDEDSVVERVIASIGMIIVGLIIVFAIIF